jgi:hypothetical protein
MSGGHIVLVKAPPGGAAAEEIWFAHLGDMDKAVHAVETSTGAARSQIIVLGTIRHAVLMDQLAVPEGEARRFNGAPAKENPG